MADPTLALQRAIFSALKTSAAVGELVADRIFDRVPPDAIVPYISFGPSQTNSDDATCVDGFEIFPQIDVWSRAVGRVEALNIAGAVRTALHGIDLPISSDFRVVDIRHRDSLPLTNPDGLTTHVAMTFRALVDPVE